MRKILKRLRNAIHRTQPIVLSSTQRLVLENIYYSLDCGYDLSSALLTLRRTEMYDEADIRFVESLILTGKIKLGTK